MRLAKDYPDIFRMVREDPVIADLMNATYVDDDPADVWDHSELFAPLTILPEQFFPEPHAVPAPTRALYAAALEDALNTIAGKEPATRSEMRRAWRWIESDDDSGPTAFVRVCEALGFDPESVRKALKTKKNGKG